jgi:hypothetical protein
MAVTIDSWPLPRMALRFQRTGRGAYQTVAGEAPQRIRYTIARQHRAWCVVRCLQRPDAGWTVDSVQQVASLKAAMDRCDGDARGSGALRPFFAATRHAEARGMA